MRNKRLALSVLLGLGALFTLSGTPNEAPNTGMADPANLMRLYNQYRAGRLANTPVVVGLTGMGNISRGADNASGFLRVDFSTGALRSQLRGMPDGEWELWLADNRGSAGSSALADSSDTMLRVGSYRPTEAGLMIEATLTREQLSGFELDRAYVTRVGQNPTSAFALTGAANFYERLARGYVALGGGLYVRRELGLPAWELEAPR